MTSIHCHLCYSPELQEHPAFRDLQRITSDCKIWPRGGKLFTCTSCGCIQTGCDNVWKDEISEIYKNYTIYYQGGGEEQKVFDSESGEALPRSEWLLRRVQEIAPLPDSGHLLDIGCGNGRFLKAFGRLYPEWKLSGTEYDAKCADVVALLPGFKKLYTGNLEEIPGTFDLISLIHVLEHIENPLPFLKKIYEKLCSGGFLLVELPSYQDNPFELLIADHATHFSVETAVDLMEKAGFNIIKATNTWVTKEISLLACASNSVSTSHEQPASISADQVVNWLEKISQEAKTLASHSRFWGIFGTSIAGTWLSEQVGKKNSFFVDEDPNRIGHLHQGLPIFSPDQIPSGSDVYVPQSPEIAKKISRRLERSSIHYHDPKTFL